MAGWKSQVTTERGDQLSVDQPRLCEALMLLAQEFADGRTPLADEAVLQQTLDELLSWPLD
jgi:hypothetical protein